MMETPKKVRPGKDVLDWLADWWAEMTLYRTAPFVPVDLMLRATEDVFVDMDKRNCDPVMLKALTQTGQLLFLRRLDKDKYSLAVSGVRVDERPMSLAAAKLKLREFVGEDGLDGGLA